MVLNINDAHEVVVETTGAPGAKVKDLIKVRCAACSLLAHRV